jgi:hypothetical protein
MFLLGSVWLQDYAERVLPSIIQETLKSVVAQYNAAQLITMREVGAPYLFVLYGCAPVPSLKLRSDPLLCWWRAH